MIAVSEKNYPTFKKLGSAGDSFNDVVTEVLNKICRPVPVERPTPRTRVQRRLQPRWSVIIPDMNSHVWAGHKLYVSLTNSYGIQQVPKPTMVTVCLTDLHEECTGTYVDTTNNFKIQCRCECHTNSNRKVRIRK